MVRLRGVRPWKSVGPCGQHQNGFADGGQAAAQDRLIEVLLEGIFVLNPPSRSPGSHPRRVQSLAILGV